MQLFNLEDDIGVVTGALGKLGPIWVETLLAAGARVLALDRPRRL
jgi:NAD(P)-dependent dehydrogenase (short-subunit alcohol dehydrogenase family)